MSTLALLVIGLGSAVSLLVIGLLLNSKEKFDNRTARVLRSVQAENKARLEHTHYYAG